MQGIATARVRPARAPKRPALSSLTPSEIPLLFCKDFRKSLSAVAGVAQALMIARVDEQHPVAFERLLVVYLRGSGTDASLYALLAEWLT